MSRAFSTFSKGIAAGLFIGAAVGMIGNPMNVRKRSRMKRNAGKALHAVGELVQNAQYFMK